MNAEPPEIDRAERLYDQAANAASDRGLLLDEASLLSLRASHPELASLFGQVHALRAVAARRLGTTAAFTVPGYRILRLLGEGGMGMVFEACDLASGREVALKVVRPELARQASIRRRFLREARALSRVQCPHCVRILGIVEEPDTLAIAMDRVVGEDLAAYAERVAVERDPQRSTGEQAMRAMVRIAADVARALETLHGHGLVHRDVKPRNILVRRSDSRALLVDFGLVRDLEGDETLTSGFAGTPAFASPEQLDPHGVVDERSDLHSLALTIRDAVDRACRGVRAPPGLDELLAIALEPDPRDRVLDAAAMAEAFDAILVGRDPARRPRSRIRRAWHDVVRSRARSAAALGLTAALAASVVLALQWPKLRDAGSAAREKVLSGREQSAFLRLVHPGERLGALAEFDALLDEDPRRMDALLGALATRVLLGRNDDARAFLAARPWLVAQVPEALGVLEPGAPIQVLETVPGDAVNSAGTAVRLRFAATARYFEALRHDRREDFAEAARLLHRLIFVEAAASPLHRGMLAFAAAQADLDELRDAAGAAIETNWAESAHAHAWLALASERKDPRRAREHAETAIRSMPGLTDWLFGLRVRCTARLGDPEAAIRMAESYVPANPSDPSSFTWLACVHEAQGDRKAAIAALRNGLRRDEHFAHLWSELGRLLAEEDDLEEAAAALRRATELAQDVAAIHANLGRVHYRRKDHASAIEELRRVRVLDPSDAISRSILGESLVLAGRAEEALVELVATEAALTTSARPPYFLARAHHALGDLDAAVAAAARAVERIRNGADGIRIESAERALLELERARERTRAGKG